MTDSYLQSLDTDGFSIQRNVLTAGQIQELTSGIDRVRFSPSGRLRHGELFGMRNLLRTLPSVRGLARSKPLRSLVTPVLGRRAVAVRGLFFDKTRAANWRLGWHQDKAIAVRRRVESPGYGPWSSKAGVPHVFPPASVLARMLTVRIHLDACDANNGALRVIPGTHDTPGLSERDFARLAESRGIRVCDVEAGDAVVMRPLLAHSSNKAERPAHRRVIHIEYADGPLSPPLEWYEVVELEAA